MSQPRLASLRLRLRTAALALVAGASLGAVAVGGCDSTLEQPCRIARREVLVSEPDLQGFRLTRKRGKIIATWERRELIDAGGRPGRDLASFEFAVVDDAGRLAERGTVPAPLLFRSRAASVESAGVVVEDGAILFHWVDTEKSTEPNGLVRTSSTLRFAYVSPLRELVVPEATTCAQCVLSVAFVPFFDETIAFVRIDPDLVDPARGLAPPRFVALRLRRDGTVKEESVPWLELPAAPATDGGTSGMTATIRTGGELRAETDADQRAVISAGDRAWVTDASLRPLGGPIALPASEDARVRWSTGATEASVAWTVAPFDDGRTTETSSRREVFIGLVPQGNSVVLLRERATRGRAVLAFDRRYDELGTLFESAGRLFFTATSPRGVRRGGDVLVRAADGRSGSEYGTPVLDEQHELIARGSGLFHVVGLGAGQLDVTEVSCAP